MNITGKLIEKYETQVVSDKFKKREFVIEFTENPQYPEFIKFELIQDKTSLLDSFNIGDHIDVSFNLKGRTWVNQQGVKQYFNSLQAWKLKSENTTQNQQFSESAQQSTESSPVAGGDDLPF